ncbi:alpha/beta hydrolase [Planktotalea sp.]|uniref:alpha/beta fold hydrolase n=1 Tax=Planktotalea sp. TaxID=2029877 RepID=UPI0025EF6FE9|nr:alpha/beta hydrolase [Planktotalea sp.]
MSKDPIGMLGRLNAASLMMITPEFYKLRSKRSKGAGKINHDLANFTMKPEFMQLDGLKIRYATGGKADGPTVLFLSPLPQSILCYDTTWSSLSPSTNLVALDLPGFGQSQGNISYMTFAAQSAFLHKFIAKLGLTDVHIVAPDVGMPVALHYVMHRDHKAKSIMIGAGPSVQPSADGSLVRKMIGSIFWRFVFTMTGAPAFIGGANQLGYLKYSPSCAEVSDYVASYSGRIGPVTKWFNGYPGGCKDIDPHLATLNVPVHVMWGEHDAFLTAGNAERLHARLPKSRLTIFKNCGHFFYQDDSDKLTKTVLAWVNGGYDFG